MNVCKCVHTMHISVDFSVSCVGVIIMFFTNLYIILNGMCLCGIYSRTSIVFAELTKLAFLYE